MGVSHLEDFSVFSELLDEQEISSALEAGTPTIVQFYMPDSVAGKVLGLEFARAARSLKGIVNMARYNIADDKSVQDRFGLRPDAVIASPVLHVFEGTLSE